MGGNISEGKTDSGTMSWRRIAFLGLAQAMGTALFIALVVLLMVGLPDVAGLDNGDRRAMEYLVAMGILLLFIISACISGALVLGYPAVLALRQRIREASLLVSATVAWLVLLLAVVFAIATLA